MKNILIIGGLGFIGSNLAHALVKRDCKITILDAEIDPYGWNHYNIKSITNKIKYKKIDIRNRDELHDQVKNKDIIFNFAGQVSRIISLENPQLDIDINIMGSITLLEAAKLCARCKVIFVEPRAQTGELHIYQLTKTILITRPTYME